MKVKITCLLLVLFASIIEAQENKADLIKDLTEGVIEINSSDLNENSPISSINKLAYEQASESIILTKENIKEALNKARSYKNIIITVGVHSIVVVNDINKTKMSGSWGCKMPWGKGYIQKGIMNFKEDYINNIIGIPDAQRRMMFLF